MTPYEKIKGHCGLGLCGQEIQRLESLQRQLYEEQRQRIKNRGMTDKEKRWENQYRKVVLMAKKKLITPEQGAELLLVGI